MYRSARTVSTKVSTVHQLARQLREWVCRMSKALETNETATMEFPSKVGRKHLEESRANEIRARLAEWKRLPESSRPSLRALAKELGTSHQLLSHYLQGWEKWQAGEYQRQAKELRKRARAETRPWVTDELFRQAEAYDQAAFRSTIEYPLGKLFSKLQRDPKARSLNRAQLRILRFLASRGIAKAREILERWGPAKKPPQNNLPLSSPRSAKSFRYGEGLAGNSSKMRARTGSVRGKENAR
jgi:hypothetical protein